MRDETKIYRSSVQTVTRRRAPREAKNSHRIFSMNIYPLFKNLCLFHLLIIVKYPHSCFISVPTERCWELSVLPQNASLSTGASPQLHRVKMAPIPQSSQREAEPRKAKVTCPSARSTSHLPDHTVCLRQSRFLDCAVFVF